MLKVLPWALRVAGSHRGTLEPFASLWLEAGADLCSRSPGHTVVFESTVPQKLGVVADWGCQPWEHIKVKVL